MAKVDLFCYPTEMLAKICKICVQQKNPIVIGIDVGVKNFALWMGLIDMSCSGKVVSLRDVSFVCLAWMHLECPIRKTHAESAAEVVQALLPYAKEQFSFAGTVGIEVQHRKNARMQCLSRALIDLFGGAPRVQMRPAYAKFATIWALEYPMPAQKAERKRAAVRATRALLAEEISLGNESAAKALLFYDAHKGKLCDLSDAELLAKDLLIRDRIQSICATTDAAYALTCLIAQRSRKNRRGGKRRTAFGGGRRAWSSRNPIQKTFAEVEEQFLGDDHCAAAASSSSSLHKESRKFFLDETDAKKRRKKRNHNEFDRG